MNKPVETSLSEHAPAEKAVTRKKPMKKRTASRLLLVQTLYSLNQSASSPYAAGNIHKHRVDWELAYIEKDEDTILPVMPDFDFYEELLAGIVMQGTVVEAQIEAAIHETWKKERLNSLVLCILRAGIFELAFRKDVPFKVVIDEYLTVARDFLDREEAGFINGKLEEIARKTRDEEWGEAASMKPSSAEK